MHIPFDLRRWRRGLTSLVAGSLVAALIAAPAGAITVGPGNELGFEIDGNLAVDSVAPNLLPDWASAPDRVVIVDDTRDSSFKGGQKELEPATWQCVDASSPPKANILRAYINPRATSDGRFVDLAWVRQETSGDTHLNFEFNQNGTATGTVAANCSIPRTDGDLLVTYDVGTSGEKELRAFIWAASRPQAPTGEPDWPWVEFPLDPASARAAINAIDVADPISGGTLLAGSFGEASLDLDLLGTGFLGASGCETNGFVNIRSRSSHSITSSLQDVMQTAAVSVSDCSSLRIEKDDDNGNNLPGATFGVFLSDGDATFEPGAGDTAAGTCITGVDGSCTVGSLNDGSYWVVETAAPAGYVFNGTPRLVALGSDVDLTVTPPFVNNKIRYRLFLSDDAVNLVKTNHVFTATLQQSTDAGATWPAASGETVTFDLTGEGSIVGPDSCVTSSDGTCTVTITGAVPGQSVVTANSNRLEVSHPVVDATKTWVDYSISINPTGLHLVGNEHEFTVTVLRNDGNGPVPVAEGEKPDVTKLTGPGVPAGGTCATIGTDEDGQCTAIFTSDETGTAEVEAVYHAVEETTSNDFTATDEATWVDYDLTVTGPGQHLVNNAHTFTVTLTGDTGSGPDLVDGATVNLAWSGATGSVPTTCVTVAGVCTVTVTETAAGPGTLTAGYHVDLDDGLDLEESATANWVDYDLTVTPDGEHLVDNAHTFTVTLTNDTGSGPGPVNGATVDLDYSGADSVPATCVTVLGVCTVTVTETTPGSGTLSADYFVEIDNGRQLGDEATANWIDYQISVAPTGLTHTAGTTQQFAVTLDVDSGDGFGPAAGETVDLTFAGVGSIVEVVGQVGTTSCVTDIDGECEVNVTSAVIGESILTGTFEAGVGEPLETASYSDEANKFWELAPVVVVEEPPTTTTTTTVPPTTPTTLSPVEIERAAVEPPAPVAPVNNPVPPAAPPATPQIVFQLPVTGAGIRDEVLLALALMAAGMVVRLAGRRRPELTED